MKLLAQTADGEVYPVTIDADGHLQVDVLSISAGDNLIGRVDARDGDKIWSYHDITEKEISDTNLAAGTNYLSGDVVPAGEIWHITSVGMYYAGTVPTEMRVYKSGVAYETMILQEFTIVSGKWYISTANLYFQEDTFVKMKISGATATDNAYLRYHGTIMQI